ncbi:MAG: type II toxin-antitoxin system death-on-curing family toxin [Acidimicrobiales bacterium]
MNLQYLELADYWVIAEGVTGIDSQTLSRTSRAELADSALHAPMASFGGIEVYPDFTDKAAVLLVRLTRNHPLLDGNKRAAWVSLRMFIALNGWRWRERPSVDDAEGAMQAIASGEWTEDETAKWLAIWLEAPAPC